MDQVPSPGIVETVDRRIGNWDSFREAIASVQPRPANLMGLTADGPKSRGSLAIPVASVERGFGVSGVA